jgi:hypothetical protein
MFWLEDDCRNTLLSYLPKRDLANLRLVCHEFGVQAAPKLFSSINIAFDSSTFTKSSKVAELDRIGRHVKKVTFTLPHSKKTFLPPLVDPQTGEEVNFTYNPKVEERTSTAPNYGDAWTTDLLTRQYPPLFHAATNVNAFVRAFALMPNIKHLRVKCPGYDTAHRYRRSVIDYALISLRIAIEQNDFSALRSLTIAPIHPGGLMYLSPLIGFGASPKSASKWTRIRNLTVHTHILPSRAADQEPNHLMLLQTYLRNFQANLQTFDFRWIGAKGPLPTRTPSSAALNIGRHPAFARTTDDIPSAAIVGKGPKPLHFPRLEFVDLENIAASASDIATFWSSHETIRDLHWDHVELTSGTWDDVHRSPKKVHRGPFSKQVEFADIPIMLAPSMVAAAATAATTTPRKPGEPIEIVQRQAPGCFRRESVMSSKWPTAKGRRPTATQKMREGWHGCEEHFKKVLRGNVFNWI